MEPQEENIWDIGHTEYWWNYIGFYGKIYIDSWLNQFRYEKKYDFFTDFKFNLEEIQSAWLVESKNWTKDQYIQIVELNVDDVKKNLEPLKQAKKLYIGYVSGCHLGLRILLNNGKRLTFTVSEDGTMIYQFCGRSTYIDRYFLEGTDGNYLVLPIYKLMNQ